MCENHWDQQHTHSPTLYLSSGTETVSVSSQSIYLSVCLAGWLAGWLFVCLSVWVEVEPTSMTYRYRYYWISRAGESWSSSCLRICLCRSIDDYERGTFIYFVQLRHADEIHNSQGEAHPWFTRESWSSYRTSRGSIRVDHLGSRRVITLVVCSHTQIMAQKMTNIWNIIFHLDFCIHNWLIGS